MVFAPTLCPVTFTLQLPEPSEVVVPPVESLTFTVIFLDGDAVPVTVNDLLVVIDPLAGEVIDTVVAAFAVVGTKASDIERTINSAKVVYFNLLDVNSNLLNSMFIYTFNVDNYSITGNK